MEGPELMDGKEHPKSHDDHENVFHDGDRGHRKVEHRPQASASDGLLAHDCAHHADGTESHDHYRSNGYFWGVAPKGPTKSQGQFDERIHVSVGGPSLCKEIIALVTLHKSSKVEELEKREDQEKTSHEG